MQLFLQCTKPEGEVLGDLMVMSGVKVSPRPFFVSGPKKMMVGMRLVGWLQVAGVVVLGDCVCSVGRFKKYE